MSKADKKGELWTFPECAELLETSQEQILATKVKVQYLGTVWIHCHIISDNLIKETNATAATKQEFHFLYDIIINIRLYNDFHYFLTFLMGKIELLSLLLVSTISADEKTYLTNLKPF